jgi:hypothetical protein
LSSSPVTLPIFSFFPSPPPSFIVPIRLFLVLIMAVKNKLEVSLVYCETGYFGYLPKQTHVLFVWAPDNFIWNKLKKIYKGGCGIFRYSPCSFSWKCKAQMTKAERIQSLSELYMRKGPDWYHQMLQIEVVFQAYVISRKKIELKISRKCMPLNHQASEVWEPEVPSTGT